MHCKSHTIYDFGFHCNFCVSYTHMLCSFINSMSWYQFKFLCKSSDFFSPANNLGLSKLLLRSQMQLLQKKIQNSQNNIWGLDFVSILGAFRTYTDICLLVLAGASLWHLKYIFSTKNPGTKVIVCTRCFKYLYTRFMCDVLWQWK